MFLLPLYQKTIFIVAAVAAAAAAAAPAALVVVASRAFLWLAQLSLFSLLLKRDSMS